MGIWEIVHHNTGGPDVVFDSSADKTMYENTLNIALNRTYIKDLNKNVLHYVYLTLFWHFCAPGVGF